MCIGLDYMIDIPINSTIVAIARMQEIVDQAVDASADAVKIEFAKSNYSV
jgi:hypothetical protein